MICGGMFTKGSSQWPANIRSIYGMGRLLPLKKKPRSIGDIINDITQIQTEWSEVQLVGTAKAAGLAKAVRESLDKLVINSNLSPEALDRGVQQTFPKAATFR
jgi:hypothetical protein